MSTPRTDEHFDAPPSATHAHDELARVRVRTLSIVDEVTDAHLRHQWLSILSPMVWDLAHVGNYEDLWLVQSLAGERLTPPHLDALYDAFRQPRSVRERLPLLGPDEARSYIGHIRERTLRAIDDGMLDAHRTAPHDELLRNGFVLGLVVQHEHQHAETLLQARQAMGDVATPLHGARLCTDHPPCAADAAKTTWLTHPGGTGTIGTSTHPWAYDNERPAHQVALEPFRIARDPVTNAQWIEFIDAGGYHTEHWWHPDGWRWRCSEDAHAPLYWRRDDDPAMREARAWRVQTFGRWHDVDLAAPVQHVSWWEADAFARFSGARLPTEHEWEAAARWRPDASLAADPSLIDAQLDAQHDGPIPSELDALPPSPIGCRSMLGGVWEWTSSRFAPWPGFRVFPYAEYSQAFFGGDYRVLRGGSWATDHVVCRSTFRNWDLPIRRQLFSGLRLASDV